MTDMRKKQLKKIIVEYESALSQSRHTAASDALSLTQITDLQTRCIAAIESISGRHSPYFRQVMDKTGARGRNTWSEVARQIGVAKALLSDIQNGYMESFEELVHGDVFGDFLEMSDHLLDAGYKDAAAVLAGSTLEVHMKKLCGKYGVETTSRGKTKKADLLNSELEKEGAYTKLDQKNITAWLGLRNKAAHGNYAEYTKDQVRLFVSSIRDFVTRHPA